MTEISGRDASWLAILAQMSQHSRQKKVRLRGEIKGRKALEIANCLIGIKGVYSAAVKDTARSLKHWAKTNVDPRMGRCPTCKRKYE